MLYAAAPAPLFPGIHFNMHLQLSDFWTDLFHAAVALELFRVNFAYFCWRVHRTRKWCMYQALLNLDAQIASEFKSNLPAIWNRSNSNVSCDFYPLFSCDFYPLSHRFRGDSGCDLAGDMRFQMAAIWNWCDSDMRCVYQTLLILLGGPS